MTDDQDDAPDIPPAISAEQWADGEYSSADISMSRARDGIAGNARVHIDVHQHPLDDVADLAAIIAFSNDTLRRCDDPRAILREHITALRWVAEFVENSGVGYDPRVDSVTDLADALESYLPPLRAEVTSTLSTDVRL